MKTRKKNWVLGKINTKPLVTFYLLQFVGANLQRIIRMEKIMRQVNSGITYCKV